MFVDLFSVALVRGVEWTKQASDLDVFSLLWKLRRGRRRGTGLPMPCARVDRARCVSIVLADARSYSWCLGPTDRAGGVNCFLSPAACPAWSFFVCVCVCVCRMDGQMGAGNVIARENELAAAACHQKRPVRRGTLSLLEGWAFFFCLLTTRGHETLRALFSFLFNKRRPPERFPPARALAPRRRSNEPICIYLLAHGGGHRYPTQGGRAGRAVEDEGARTGRRDNGVQQRAAVGLQRRRPG